MEEGDGYARLLALLPPPERRGLVLIDPPFEAPTNSRSAARVVREALRRKFATGIYLIWYPIKSDAAGNAFVGEVLASGAAKALKIEIAIDGARGQAWPRRVCWCSIRPFSSIRRWQAALAAVAPQLQAKTRLDWLAGEG